jgi:ATP-dependent DNA helicase RecG
MAVQQAGNGLEVPLAADVGLGHDLEILTARFEFSRCRPRIAESWFEFPFSSAYVDSLVSEEGPQRVSGQTAQETTQETTQERILALLREEPTLTRKALADRIGITPDGIKYHLARLRDAGRIRHVGPTKKGHWEVLESSRE